MAAADAHAEVQPFWRVRRQSRHPVDDGTPVVRRRSARRRSPGRRGGRRPGRRPRSCGGARRAGRAVAGPPGTAGCWPRGVRGPRGDAGLVLLGHRVGGQHDQVGCRSDLRDDAGDARRLPRLVVTDDNDSTWARVESPRTTCTPARHQHVAVHGCGGDRMRPRRDGQAASRDPVGQRSAGSGEPRCGDQQQDGRGDGRLRAVLTEPRRRQALFTPETFEHEGELADLRQQEGGRHRGRHADAGQRGRGGHQLHQEHRGHDGEHQQGR